MVERSYAMGIAVGVLMILGIGWPEAASQNEEKDKAKIVLKQFYPTRVLWTSGEEKGEIEDVDSALVLPGKAVSVQQAERFGGTYSAIFVRHRLNGGKMSDITPKAWEGELRKGDVLEVHVVGVAVPNHSVIVPYKDGALIVSVVFPAAIPNGDDFKGKEEYRSSAMFVAKYGYKTVSRNLAKFALTELGNARPNHGKFRDSQQLAVIFPMRDGKPLPGQAAGTEDELTEAIEVGLRTIGTHDFGNSTFNNEVEKAKLLLKQS